MERLGRAGGHEGGSAKLEHVWDIIPIANILIFDMVSRANIAHHLPATANADCSCASVELYDPKAFCVILEIVRMRIRLGQG
jgi:hypothetical protein